MTILDATSGERLQEWNFDIGVFPHKCVRLPNTDWMVLAFRDEVFHDNGNLFKFQAEAPYMNEAFSEQVVAALFVA